MLRIVLTDGATFEGQTATDIVTQLKLDDWTAYTSPKHYKKNMERRIRQFNGKRIEYSNDDEFLGELKRIGFIYAIFDITDICANKC